MRGAASRLYELCGLEIQARSRQYCSSTEKEKTIYANADK